MKALSLASVGVAFVLLASVQGGEPKDNQAKIVGLWEVVKSEETSAGSTVEFTKAGKLILIQKGKDPMKIEASYKVDGKMLTTTRKEMGKDEVNVLTIQTLNDTTLITLNDKGKTDELKRVKPK